MERYIEEGIQRHHNQQRAFEFDHYDYRVRAASLPLGPLGRIRLWRKTAPLAHGDAGPDQPQAGTTASADFAGYGTGPGKSGGRHPDGR